MAEKLLKTKPRKLVAKMDPADNARKPEEIVVVGNYKEGQLDWIKENHIYNWPVREEDGRAGCPQPADFAQIKELWLYASAKSQRHVFTAQFVGKMTAAEFKDKIAGFKSRLADLNAKGSKLDKTIAANLDKLEFVR